ncbi:MAG: hypothetical protein ACD_79C01531G0002 [uncultured bacterium]|nr:MAG: hypothetical protein ACD_79C01531G0002 [uncultured bacterium]
MKTNNALKILKKKIDKDKHLKALVVEEECNLNIANILRKLREEHNLSQEKLAKLTNTTQSVISRLEDADYHGYTLKILEKMATALNQKLTINFEPLKTV